MAGLEQLQVQDYQRNMSPGAMQSMAPLNALWAGRQQRNLEQQQGLQLQSNQAQTLEDVLKGNVAQAQNNPQGIQTLAQGVQGVAQGQAAAGQVAKAEAPVKVTAADIDFVQKKFEKAQQSLQLYGPMGLSKIDDPDVKQVIEIGLQKSPNLGPSEILDQLLQGVSVAKNKQLEAEAKAKKAPEILNANTEAEARKYAADKAANAKITYGTNANESRVEVANIKATMAKERDLHKQELSKSDTPKALDAAYLREKAKISSARAKAIETSMMTPELEQAFKDQEVLLTSDYNGIRAKYNNPLPVGTPAKDVSLKMKKGFAASPDQEKSIANAVFAIQKKPEIRGEVIKRLKEAGIQIEE